MCAYPLLQLDEWDNVLEVETADEVVMMGDSHRGSSLSASIDYVESESGNYYLHILNC